jgi:hypothetical protein
MVNYKNGDRIKCIDPGTHRGLTLNKIYKCVRVHCGRTSVRDDFGHIKVGFFTKRFILAVPELNNKVKVL